MVDNDKITLSEMGRGGTRTVPACEITEVALRLLLGRRGFEGGIIFVPAIFDHQQSRVHRLADLARKKLGFTQIPEVVSVLV